MTVHEWKVKTEYWDVVERNSHSLEMQLKEGEGEWIEWRLGDTIRAREWDTKTEMYTGRWFEAVVTYVEVNGLRTPNAHIAYGLSSDWKG